MTQCEPMILFLFALSSSMQNIVHTQHIFVNSFLLSFSVFLRVDACDSIWSQWTIYIPRNHTLCQFQYFLFAVEWCSKWQNSNKKWTFLLSPLFGGVFCERVIHISQSGLLQMMKWSNDIETVCLCGGSWRAWIFGFSQFYRNEQSSPLYLFMADKETKGRFNNAIENKRTLILMNLQSKNRNDRWPMVINGGNFHLILY